eukprot:TCONS_00046420-protein
MGCISPLAGNLKAKSYFLTPKLKASTSTPKTTPSSINKSNKTASSISSPVNKPIQTSSSVISKSIQTSSSASKPIKKSPSVSNPIKKSPSTVNKPIQIATSNHNSIPIESQTATDQSSLTSNNSSNETSAGVRNFHYFETLISNVTLISNLLDLNRLTLNFKKYIYYDFVRQPIFL